MKSFILKTQVHVLHMNVKKYSGDSLDLILTSSVFIHKFTVNRKLY